MSSTEVKPGSNQPFSGSGKLAEHKSGPVSSLNISPKNSIFFNF